MKRIVAIIILLACFAVAKGQQSYWTPGVPPGSTSFSPTFRGKPGTTDSLNHFYISIGNKWYELPTYPKLWFYPDTVYFKGTGSAPSDPFTLNLSNTPTATNNFLLAKNSNGYIVPINANFSTSTNTIIFNGIKINANGGLQTNAPIASGAGTFLKQNTSTGLVEKDTASYLPYYTASGYRVIKGLPLKIYPQVSLYNTPTYPTKWPDSLLVKNGKVINAYPYWNVYNHSDTLTKNIDIDDNGHQLQIGHADGSTGVGLTVIGATEVTAIASNISSGAQGTVDVQVGSVAITGTGGFGNQAQQIVNNSGALTSFQDNSLGFPTNSQLSLSDSVLMEYTYQDEFSATKNKGIGLNPTLPGLTVIDDTKIGMTNNSNDFTPTDSTYTTKHYNDLHYATAGSGVSSFNTRTGAVTLSSGDVTTALGFTPVTNARTVAGFALSSNVTLGTLTLGNGLTGTSYNPSGATTAKLDTSIAQTVLNFFPKGDTRYARTGSTGTVTSIATSTGITGGTITSTGTLKADTSILQTVLNFKPKGNGYWGQLAALNNWSARNIVSANVAVSGSTQAAFTSNATVASGSGASGQNVGGFFGITSGAGIANEDQVIPVVGAIYNLSNGRIGVAKGAEFGYFANSGTGSVALGYGIDILGQASTGGTIDQWDAIHIANPIHTNVTLGYTIASDNTDPSYTTGTFTLNGGDKSITLTPSAIFGGYNATASSSKIGDYGFTTYNSNANQTGTARPFSLTNAYNGNSFAVLVGSGATTPATLNSSLALNTGTVGLVLSTAGVLTLPQLSSAGIVLNSAAGVISTGTALPAGTTATTQAAGDNSTKVATTAYVDAIGSTAVTAIGVTTANGVSGSSSGGTTPNLTISLAAITPTTIVANSIALNGSLANNLYIGTANGVTHQTNALVLVDGAAGMGTRSVVSGTAGSNTANDAYGGLFVTGQTVTIPTGTAPLVAPLIVKNPTVTATGTITDLATIYSQGGNSAGAANWNIWAKYGVTRVSGLRIDSATLTFNSVNFTGTTGTVNLVGSASPTFSGTITSPGASLTAATIGALNGTGSNLWTGSQTNIVTSSATPMQYASSSTVYARAGLGLSTTSTTIGSGNSYVNTIVGAAPFTTASASTTPWGAQLVVNKPGTITLGASGATLTNFANLYVDNATTTAGSNYTIWAGTGLFHIDALTASKVVFTDANKNLTSTGIGTSSQYILGDGTLGTIGARAHTIFTPTTGGTVNLTNNQYNIINPAGALLALTVSLPSSPANNDCVFIKFTQNVTTVTYSNGTVQDGITAPTAGGLTVLTYDGASSIWY